MRNLIKKTNTTAFIMLLALTLSACGFFDKDNTPVPKPLVSFKPELQPRLLWAKDVGSGSDGEYLKLGPVISGNTIFTVGLDGRIMALDKTSGKRLWETNVGFAITASPAVNDHLLAVGGRDGNVALLQQINGAVRWKIIVPGEILAPPAFNDDLLVIKTVDGFVRALSLANGRERWSYQQIEPSLILRGASAPVVRDHALFVGFANGTLSKFNVQDGQLLWTQTIALPQGAFSIQRMIDIDADPVVFNHHLYAATYQGKIASLDWMSGQILWSYDLSSYTGMTVDSNAVYISDAHGEVWAFDANSDKVLWRLTDLDARNVTAPAQMYHYLVVADAEGYVHWLSKQDGHFAARVKVGDAVFAAPIVDQNTLYVLTSEGKLFAYTLS